MNRQDFQQIANTRLRETQALFKARQCSGAYYLGGYVVECALKACIAKQTRHHDFPDKDRVNKSYTHKYMDLIKVLELTKTLEAKTKSDPDFSDSWATVLLWSEQSRYQKYTRAEAQALYDAIADSAHGFLQWLKQLW